MHRRPRSAIAVLALCGGIGAGVFVHAGQKESPIRVGLPGVSAVSRARPQALPTPAPRAVNTIHSAAPRDNSSARPTRLPPTAVKTLPPEPAERSTVIGAAPFPESPRAIETSQTQPTAHPFGLPAINQQVASRLPVRLTTGPASQEFVDSVVPEKKPRHRIDTLRLPSHDVTARPELPAAITSPTRADELDQQRLSRTVNTQPANAGTQAKTPPPTTAFHAARFKRSIDESSAEVATRNATSPVPATDYQLEPFNQTLQSELVEAVPPPNSVKVPATGFDANRFNQVVESSIPTTPPRIALPTHPVTGFDQDRFAAAITSSLVPTGTPRTVFDANLFSDSVVQSITQEEMPRIVDVPTTDFSAQRFDRSMTGSLSAIRAAADPIASGEVSKKKAVTWPTEHGARCQPQSDFSPTPLDPPSLIHNEYREALPYDAKFNVPTQAPWVQLGREFYGDGITPPGINLFGEKNMVRPELYVYGDYRTAVSAGRNAVGRTDNWANRLNLDVDLQITDTERFHAFVGPLDEGNQFTRLELVEGDLRYRQAIDFTPATAFFEGDLGVFLGTAFDRTSPFELPFTMGLVPLLFQNGIWMEDAVTGAAFALPARHSRLLNWSNYDATFFAVFDQLNSVAFGANEHAAQAFGTAWFIEAYGGYIESGYAYVRDRNRSELSYHNITTSFTRRYFDRISNSVRVIVNTGQDLPSADRTADGVLLLVENSWITQWPLTVVPYANFFVGWDRPQSVGRAAVSGQILRNTGINFDTDGLNGFATLDASGNGTAGCSLGIDLIGDCLDRQLLVEFAYLTPNGSSNAAVPGDQYAIGSRYQFPISNWSLLRFDNMYGWRQGLEDVYGTRMEYRWKF